MQRGVSRETSCLCLNRRSVTTVYVLLNRDSFLLGWGDPRGRPHPDETAESRIELILVVIVTVTIIIIIVKVIVIVVPCRATSNPPTNIVTSSISKSILGQDKLCFRGPRPSLRRFSKGSLSISESIVDSRRTVQTGQP